MERLFKKDAASVMDEGRCQSMNESMINYIDLKKNGSCHRTQNKEQDERGMSDDSARSR